MPIENLERTYRNKLIRFPENMINDLKILMIDHMQKTQETTDFTNFIIFICKEYLRNNGGNIDDIQRKHILMQVERAEKVFSSTSPKVDKQVFGWWLGRLRKYRQNVQPGSDLDKRLSELITINTQKIKSGPKEVKPK